MNKSESELEKMIRTISFIVKEIEKNGSEEKKPKDKNIDVWAWHKFREPRKGYLMEIYYLR